ncbi:MAG: acetyl-CoA carboxylase biotin carboxyl carrier protein [Elusimicrobiota bacterium]
MKETVNEKGKPLKKQVSALYDLMKSENLDELEIKDNGLHVHLKRKGIRAKPQVAEQLPRQTKASASEQQSSTAPAREGGNTNGDTIKSPITGVFYRAPSPSSPPFIKEGDTIDTGKTLCIVEAMKVMNEIKAENRMKILKILLENGKSVTAGQEILVIEKL